MGARQFGARVDRLEDPALLTGRGRYLDDIELPGMLHAAFLRSEHANARVTRIDVSAAEDCPGVHAVLTTNDLPDGLRTIRMPLLVPNTSIKAQRTEFSLAHEEIRYVGQPIALVLADSRYLAEDALEHIVVEYEVYPAVQDVRLAALPDGPFVHPQLKTNVIAQMPMEFGDVETAFSSAAHVFHERIWQHRGGGNALETRGVIAHHDLLSDMLVVYSATQTPHRTRSILAAWLERNIEQIRCIAPDVGGGFGPKSTVYSEEAIIAWAAMHTRRPVKFTEDRREHFLCATQERDQYWDVSIATDTIGKILGVRGTLLHDAGAYLPWGIILPYIAAVTMPGPYVIPAYRLDLSVVYTNMVPTTPVRGAGRPQAVFAMERLMDRVARELDIDPAELRRRNFVQPEQMPYSVGLIFRDGRPLVYDSGDYPLVQKVALERACYETFKQRQRQALAEKRYIGIGIANYVEGSGLGPFEGVTLRVLPDGKVKLISGATSQGQGTRTTLSQIVADQLGCRMSDIVTSLGDTADIPNGMGAFASRQAVNAGSSALIAANEVRNRILRLAARHLGVTEEDIDIEDGVATARGGNQPSVGFGELALMAQGMPGFSMAPGDFVGLEHTAYFTPPQATYCSGCHVVEVEVDIGTGAVKILSYTVGHDSGRLINPKIVDGQIQGGVAHGVGNALLEWMKYDDIAQPLTVTFADYLMPMATDVPTCAIEHVEIPCPLNPLGVKGAGEGGTIPAAAAIIAAIENALSPFGVKFSDTPLFPEKIVETLRAAGAYVRKHRERRLRA